jgi:diaminohydroxyphosphoribosylaminopyrimidine deaminase/5-amino-6-(5-phosphoribosylamino)uracil reductase
MQAWSREERLMADALAEAEKGRGRTHPNPIVGAVIVSHGAVVAQGHHQRAGGPHAEVAALAAAGDRARGAEIYVTLEPCNHHGKTPPCTEALIAAGVRRVVVGSMDPNPLVNGRGVQRLRDAGIEVVTGVLEDECDAANEGWFKFITTGVPWVVLKAAVTLDGKLATRSGDSKWVTGEAARARVHQWRDQLDAVLVGTGTVRKDDPQLTVRGVPDGRNPVRVVLGDIPAGARILREPGETLSLKGSVRAVLAELAGRGLTTVLVEGGADVHGRFLRENLWDELRLFVAPRIAGNDGLSWAGLPSPVHMSDALRLDLRKVEHLGDDLLLHARPVRPG